MPENTPSQDQDQDRDQDQDQDRDQDQDQDRDTDADTRSVPAPVETLESDPGAPELVGTLVRYDGAPDEYTVHPPDATETELLTTWLTAERADLVDLDRMR
jgi:hypothetical protein